ncbi:hypothetical protein ACJX0J_028983, partial [Zea mays]
EGPSFQQMKMLSVGECVKIQLTGFMEKNTVKFMKELWSLLLSAQQNASGVPQQFLDEKEAEIHQKKDDRIAQEIQKKPEKEGMDSELEKNKTMDGDVIQILFYLLITGYMIKNGHEINQATLSTCSNSGLHYLSGQGTSQRAYYQMMECLGVSSFLALIVEKAICCGWIRMVKLFALLNITYVWALTHFLNNIYFQYLWFLHFYPLLNKSATCNNISTRENPIVSSTTWLAKHQWSLSSKQMAHVAD